MSVLVRILRWLHIVRTEILWTFVGTISGVWLTLHLVEGLEHSILLDFGMVLVVAALIFFYDRITHRHEGEFTYHIDHERLEKACHLSPPPASRQPSAGNKTPGRGPGESHYQIHRKFTGRE